MNQIGFYLLSVKQFVVANMDATLFDVVDENNKIVFSGKLSNNGI